MLELGNLLKDLAAEAFIISCIDRNALTRIRKKIYLFYKFILLSFHIFRIYFRYLFIFSAFIWSLVFALAENPGPQGKLGVLDFPLITEIDSVNFGTHSLALEGGVVRITLTHSRKTLDQKDVWKYETSQFATTLVKQLQQPLRLWPTLTPQFLRKSKT